MWACLPEWTETQVDRDPSGQKPKWTETQVDRNPSGQTPEWTDIAELAFERQEPSSLPFPSGQYLGFRLHQLPYKSQEGDVMGDCEGARTFDVTCYCEGAREKLCKKSWEGDVNCHCAGACDLRLCLKKWPKKLAENSLKKCS